MKKINVELLKAPADVTDAGRGLEKTCLFFSSGVETEPIGRGVILISLFACRKLTKI